MCSTLLKFGACPLVDLVDILEELKMIRGRCVACGVTPSVKLINLDYKELQTKFKLQVEYKLSHFVVA